MKGKFALIVLLQVTLLVGIIGYREYWVAVGDKILLRTTPLDPRDLFRGDYVQLSYEIASIDLDRLGVKENFKANQTVYVTLDTEEDGTCKVSGISRMLPAETSRFIQGRVRYQQPMQRWEVVVKDGAGSITSLTPRWFTGMNRGDRAVFCLGPRNAVVSHSKVDGYARPKCDTAVPLEGTIEDIKEIKYQQLTVEYGIESYFVEEGKGRAIERARNAREVKVEVALREDGKGIISGLVMEGPTGPR